MGTVIDATTWTAFTPLPKPASSAAEHSQPVTQPAIVGQSANAMPPTDAQDTQTAPPSAPSAVQS